MPYRLQMNLDPAPTHTVTIGWDTTEGGQHALDYLTTYNRTETDANPCSGVPGCVTAGGDTEPIPADTAMTGQADWDGTQAPGVFTLFGGTITGVSGYTYTGSFAGSGQAKITVTFTATVLNPVLAWAGHIADHHDWGTGNAARDISGSPFHMQPGSPRRDRWQPGPLPVLQRTVIFPGSITIVKDAVPEKARRTSASPPPAGSRLPRFTLDDDAEATRSNAQVARGPSGLQPGRPVHGHRSFPARMDPDRVPPAFKLKRHFRRPAVSIGIDEGGDIICTYTNTRQPPAIISVLKDAVPTTRFEPGGATVFNLSVTNESSTSAVTINSLNDSIFGNVTAVAGRITATNCTVPRTIAAGGSTSCSFTATITGQPGFAETDVVTASGTDSAGNAVSDTDDAVVTITDLPPLIQVDKAAVPTTRCPKRVAMWRSP